MSFQPLSFALGTLAVAALVFAAWKARARLIRLRVSTESQIEGTRRFIGRSADARYAREVARLAQAHHLAGASVRLTDILVEPRLLPGPQPVLAPESGTTAASVFDVIPLFHDLPPSYAPYNVETFPLGDLGAGDRQIALLGISGAGKSTALAALALLALGELRLETLEALSEQAIFEEEQYLADDERAERVRERERIQTRALDKLHDVHQQERARVSAAAQQDRLPPVPIPGLVPVLVHLRDLDLSPGKYGKGSADPAEPLVEAMQRQVGPVTGQVAGSVVYSALEAGRALLLLDGYDELTLSERDGVFHWLRSLVQTYPSSLMVIAGPATGYAPLEALGFTPAFLRPWNDSDAETLVRRWSAAWSGSSKRGAPADDQTLRRLTIDNRGRTPLDLTLKIWTGLANDAQRPGRPGWYDAFVTRRLSSAHHREALPWLAAYALDHGGVMALDEAADALADEAGADGKKPVQASDLLDGLVKDGLARRHPGNRFSFVHAQIAAFLGGEALIARGAEAAAASALEPAWFDALGVAAAELNRVPVVYRHLSSAPDLIYSQLFELVRWMPDAPPDAPWRGDLFKRLAAALVAPEQYPALRERALAALIASRDRNVLFILRQALRSTDPHIRQLACVGLGALGDPEALRDLAPMLGDAHRNVQLAAGLALGAIGTERALEIMVQGLLEGSDELRRAVAETLAAIPDGGHAILRDGILADDIMIRRATVYGLSRVRASWALVALYRAMMEDEQWYVRTAAEEAFMAARAPEQDGPRAHPEADALPWLIGWAAERGEGVPHGSNARQVLIRALQDGASLERAMAAITLGRMGHLQALKPLYAALRDRNAEVRAAAFSALAEIQLRTGLPLPAVA